MDEHVWYVAYGSNLDAGRFRHYLEGGTPAGARRAMRGARDPSPPRVTEACTMQGRLRFARHSRTWGGGVAFLEPGADGAVLGRRYLVTVTQFEDVFAQENASPTRRLDLDDPTSAAAGPGWYRRLVRLGDHAGHPQLTFTEREPAPEVAPSAAYLTPILRGLAAAHRLDARSAATHLLPSLGDGPWTALSLEAHAVMVLEA